MAGDADQNKCKHFWSFSALPKCMYCNAVWNGMTGKISHVNPNCKDASKCNPHDEFESVSYREK